MCCVAGPTALAGGVNLAACELQALATEALMAVVEAKGGAGTGGGPAVRLALRRLITLTDAASEFGFVYVALGFCWGHL